MDPHKIAASLSEVAVFHNPCGKRTIHVRCQCRRCVADIVAKLPAAVRSILEGEA